MLQELYIWSLSNAVAGARSAGLVYEVAAIAGRHRRNHDSWRPHLERVKNIISATLCHAEKSKPVLLLGAGLGLDIPFAALNAHPAGAILVDAVETPQMRAHIRHNKNLTLECADITGFLALFWQSKTGDELSPPLIAPILHHDCGLVISCNILSQLPLCFANSPPNGDTEIRITDAVQQAHMRALEAFKCPVLLITDYERIETTEGTKKTVLTVPPHLLPGDANEEWMWDISPLGEAQDGSRAMLKVGAWLFGC